MALIPMLLTDLLEDLDSPYNLLNELPVAPRTSAARMYLRPSERKSQPLIYYRPWASLMRDENERGSSTIEANKDKFQVVLDVQQFQPEEIDVKVVDKFVVVSAKHEERQDEHGWISREFVRKYMIPEQCDLDKVSSKLSTDGILTIVVPKKDQPKVENERTIKIEQTGKPAAISSKNESAKAVKQGQEEGKEEKKK